MTPPPNIQNDPPPISALAYLTPLLLIFSFLQRMTVFIGEKFKINYLEKKIYPAQVGTGFRPKEITISNNYYFPSPPLPPPKKSRL